MSMRNGKDRGAAEMIGVLMLVSIFVVAAGVLAVMYFSTPTPEKAPAVKMVVTNESRHIVLSHAGGDPLFENRTQIFVDNTLRTFSGYSDNYMWSLGENLEYTVSPSDPIPQKIDVVYNETESFFNSAE